MLALGRVGVEECEEGQEGSLQDGHRTFSLGFGLGSRVRNLPHRARFHVSRFFSLGDVGIRRASRRRQSFVSRLGLVLRFVRRFNLLPSFLTSFSTLYLDSLRRRRFFEGH